MKDSCPVVMAKLELGGGTARGACRSCRRNATSLWRRSGLTVLQLDSFSRPEDRELAQRLRSEQESNPKGPMDWHGIDFRGVASYSLLLRHKAVHIDESHEAWTAYLQQLEISVLVYLASRRLGQEVMDGQTDESLAIARNGLHPNASSFLHGMTASGLTGIFVDGGLHSRSVDQTILVTTSATEMLDYTGRAAALRAMSRPLSRDALALLESHLFDLQQGRTPLAYSPSPRTESPTDVRASLGIPGDAPIVAVLTSSEDEIAAARSIGALPYERQDIPDQLAWLTQLLPSFAGTGVFAVVRIHPRMAHSRRAPSEASQLTRITNLIREFNLPNVVLDHPDDARSLRAIVGVSSVCANHQSSAGLEFIAQGVPVSHLFPEASLSYPAQQISLGRSWATALELTGSRRPSDILLYKVAISLRWWSALLSRVPLRVISQDWDSTTSLQPHLEAAAQGLTQYIPTHRLPYFLEYPVRVIRNASQITRIQEQSRTVDSDEFTHQFKQLGSRSLSSARDLDHSLVIGLQDGELALLQEHFRLILDWHSRSQIGMGALSLWKQWVT